MREAKMDVLTFWFEETAPQQWFQQSDELDALVRERFAGTHEMAKDGHCDDWAHDADGALALVVLLDQFPRHMFRGTPESFATDKQALLIAKDAIHKGFDQVLNPTKRGFLYLPFQHSEHLPDQKRSVELFGSMKNVNPTGYMYAKRHYEPIEKFDRFPHRNEVLGRESTAEEVAFLATHGGFL